MEGLVKLRVVDSGILFDVRVIGMASLFDLLCDLSNVIHEILEVLLLLKILNFDFLS